MNLSSDGNCPSRDQLRQSLASDFVLSGEFVSHIERCPSCQSSLDGLTTSAELSDSRVRWQSQQTTSARLSPPLRPQDLGSIGQFAVESVLGVGGMGIVYRGWDTLLDRAVAIKLVKPNQSTTAQERFRRECLALAKIQHDHIVPVFSSGQFSDGTSYLILPLMTGGSLSELLVKKLLTPHEAASIVHGIALGLTAAHANDLIHRDVKPANILFDVPGGRPKLTDFGLVRSPQSDGLTQTDVICGTPEYMSPEQAHHPDDIDSRSDLYSLGITLYESLTGVPPYRGRPLDILQQHRWGEPLPPSRLNHLVPRDLEAICLKTISTRPDDRYPNATELANDLLRFLESRPVRAKPVTRWQRARLWYRRNPSLASSLIAAFVFLLTSSIISSLFWYRSESHARQVSGLNSQLATANSQLLDNRNRLRQSVNVFQKKVFSAEALHWQMGREFRAAMFRDVVDFLDEFAAHAPLQPDDLQPDSSAADYLEVARAALNVGQNDEALLAANRAVERLRPITLAVKHDNLGNWQMLNESSRILWHQANTPASGYPGSTPANTEVVQAFTKHECLELCKLSAAQSARLAPQATLTIIQNLATQYAELALQPHWNESQQLTGEALLDQLLDEILPKLDEERNDELFPQALELAVEVAWKLSAMKPESWESWVAQIDRFALHHREQVRSSQQSILGIELLRSKVRYRQGQLLVQQGKHAEANEAYQQSLNFLRNIVKLQPQNRRAVWDIAEVSEAATRAAMYQEDFVNAQKILDASLIVTTKSLQTDPSDTELRIRVIEWFCLYGQISLQIEDFDWAVKAYGTAAGDCLLFPHPSPELQRWIFTKRRFALEQLLAVIDRSSLAAQKANFERALESWLKQDPFMDGK